MINDCEKCQAHDDRTKALYVELLHPEERVLISLLLGNSIKMRSMMQSRMKGGDVNRLRAQRDIDFSAAVLGKVMLSFTPEERKTADKALAKIGIGKIVFHHEACPHKEALEPESSECPA